MQFKWIGLLHRSARSQTIDDPCEHSSGTRLAIDLSWRCRLESFHRVRFAGIGGWVDGRPSNHLPRRNMVKIYICYSKLFSISSKFVQTSLFSEPSSRGTLVSLTPISVTIGSFLCLFLNTLMPWRSIALVFLTCPIMTAIAICFVRFCWNNFYFQTNVKLRKFHGKMNSFLDSRDAAMAFVERSTVRGRKVALLASWLGSIQFSVPRI